MRGGRRMLKTEGEKMEMGTQEQEVSNEDGSWIPGTPLKRILSNSVPCNQFSWSVESDFSPKMCADERGESLSNDCELEKDATVQNAIPSRGVPVHRECSVPAAAMHTTQEDHCRTSNAFSSSSFPQFAPLTPEKATRNEKRKEQENGDEEARLAARELELSKELKMHTANLLDAICKEDHSKDTGGNEATKLDKEDHMIETRGNETTEVDNTNKTPQKKQRRKKHRPKVLEEGEVKTQRTTNRNHGIPKENPTTKKRKYMRRKAPNASPTPAAETREGPDKKTTVSPDSRGKSICKRKYVRRKHLNNASMTSPEEATPGSTGTAAAMGESDKKTNVSPDSEGATTCKRKYVRRKQLNKGLTTFPEEFSPKSSDPNITAIDVFDGSPTNKSKSQQRKASRKVWFTLPEENETSSNLRITEVSTSDEKPGKKQRGRSKVSETSTTPQTGVTTRSINQNITGATRKPCQRALNFDIEGNSGNDCSRCKPVMNVDSQTRTTDTGEGNQVNSTMLLGCGVEVIARRNQNCATYDLDSYVDEMLKDYVSERNAPSTSAPAMSTPSQNNLLAQNLENHAIGMHLSAPNLQESTSQTMSQVGTLLSLTHPDGSFSSIYATLTDGDQEKGSKRKHYISFGQGDSHCTNATGILYNGLLAYQNIAQLEESYEKTRVENGWTSLFPVTSGNIGQAVVQNYSEGPISNINCHIVPPSDPTEEILVDCVIQQLEGFPNPITSMESLAVDLSSVLTPKKRRKKRDRVVQVPTTPLGNEDKLQEKAILFNQDQFLENAPSAPTDFMWKQMLSFDEIANQLKNLDIERENTEIHDINGGALVPCTVRNLNQGELALYTDGTIVLYDGSFQHIKKRRGRPKVELDDETNRMWNLLMESDNTEGVDGTNEEREKWWEEQRDIFHGRANSFIARMRLVQGERHFSRWKGSVVDSVVGVFLTQNVADHLSSSAFMSLVARFPLKSNPYQCDDMESSSCVTSSGTLHKSEQEEQEVADSDGSDCASTLSHTAEKSLMENNSAGNVTHGSELNHPSESKEQELNDALRKAKSKRIGNEIQENFDWDSLRKQAEATEGKRERLESTMDSLDWEAVRSTRVEELANIIRDRGMNNRLAARIQAFLNRLVRDHGSIDLEWLRDVRPDKVKDYLLSFRGLGLKSVECVRLLTLHHLAFPVDTNVGRIAVRLGWVPLRPLPESLQLHLLEMYPVMESIQKYLWPRLCKLDQRTLYELHYQMITFGKVFCTKSKPNCNACPMRGECRHFASAFTSARLALPGPEQKGMVSVTENRTSNQKLAAATDRLLLPQSNAPKHLGENDLPRASSQEKAGVSNSIPIVEEPSTPEPEPEPEPTQALGNDIEDLFLEDPDEIPIINLNIEQFTQNLQNYMQSENMELEEGDLSRALVALTAEAAAIPVPKLKNVSRLRTEHQVYELPDSHPLVQGLDRREPDDPIPYLLAIWTPGELADSIEPPENRCTSQEGNGELCKDKTCFSCNSAREANSQIVRGTLLIPCRTAMKGSFPLNGTYFQVNEVFADHESSLNPINVPRAGIWNLPRRTVYFGTSVPTIFRGLRTEEIQHCFWRGYVCVRGFDRKTRAPRPLKARLHLAASKLKARNANYK